MHHIENFECRIVDLVMAIKNIEIVKKKRSPVT